MKIAPDVERMMWMVAESADPNAIEDFGARFPQLRYELAKRIDMVRQLKASGRFAKPDGSIPRFVPPSKFGAPIGSRFRWGFAAVALSALAFGSYFGAKYVANSHPESVTKKIEVPPVKYSPQLPQKDLIVPHQEPDVPPLNEHGVKSPDDEPPPKSEQLLAVKFEKIGLANAIKAIGLQSGLRVEMPPDMPNDDIVVNYQGMTGMEMLQDMASRFGFTVFDQGEGKILVIPARQGEGEANPNPGNTKTALPEATSDPGR